MRYGEQVSARIGGRCVAMALICLLGACARVTPPVDAHRQANLDAANVEELIAAMNVPSNPPFKALNEIIAVGNPAVPMLIETTKTSTNWQYPKALGVIGDKRAVKPLIDKLGDNPAPPMRAVVAEALTRITGQDLGVSAAPWNAWWASERRQ